MRINVLSVVQFYKEVAMALYDLPIAMRYKKLFNEHLILLEEFEEFLSNEDRESLCRSLSITSALMEQAWKSARRNVTRDQSDYTRRRKIPTLYGSCEL